LEALAVKTASTGFNRSAPLCAAAGALAILCLAALCPAPTQGQAARKTQAEKDSLKALNRAVQSLRQYGWQLDLLAQQGAPARSPTAGMVKGVCEVQVATYCYGPRNGQLTYGGFGTWAASLRFGPRRYPGSYAKRYNWAYNRYMDSLRSIHKVIPGDRWILGELLRLPLEHQSYGLALEHLSHCASDDWYCNALIAYMLQISGALPRADTVWTRVLGMMPDIERCAWLDPSWVSSDPGVAKTIRSMTCAERERVARRVWWLADPLYSRPGNERLAEHLTRSVELLIRLGHARRAGMNPAMVLRTKSPPADSSVLYMLRPEIQLKYAPWGVSLGWGYSELLMRLGPPRFFASGDEGTIAQYPPERMAFVPNGRIFLNHLAARAADWNINHPLAFEFMNGWYTPVNDLPFQLAWFRRGDSARVIAVADARGDSTLIRSTPAATLFMQRDFDEPQRLFKGSDGPLFRFDFSTAGDSTVASIELLARNGNAGRARFASGPQVMPDQRLTLSDLLLLEPDGALPSSLDAASLKALGGTQLPERSAVGVYWEMYGAEPADSIDVQLSIVRIRTPSIGGAIRGLFGAALADSMLVSWTEAPTPRAEVEPRSINISPAELTPGRYVLSIVVSVRGLQRVVSSREVEILRR
jgi:hypothetical protein